MSLVTNGLNEEKVQWHRIWRTTLYLKQGHSLHQTSTFVMWLYPRVIILYMYTYIDQEFTIYTISLTQCNTRQANRWQSMLQVPNEWTVLFLQGTYFTCVCVCLVLYMKMISACYYVHKAYEYDFAGSNVTRIMLHTSAYLYANCIYV